MRILIWPSFLLSIMLLLMHGGAAASNLDSAGKGNQASTARQAMRPVEPKVQVETNSNSTRQPTLVDDAGAVALGADSKSSLSLLLANTVRTSLSSTMLHHGCNQVSCSIDATAKERWALLGNDDYRGYFFNLIVTTFNGTSWMAIIGALFVAFFWGYYIRLLDALDEQSWLWYALVFIMGVISAFITIFAYDLIDVMFKIYYPDMLMHNILYDVLVVGVLEETLKIIPLLILLWLAPKQFNEPFDFIKFAALSAIGFAFMENAVYSGKFGLAVINQRALVSIIGHMFYSCFIAYGIMLNWYRKKRRHKVNFFYYFAIAVIAHGAYDWFITLNYGFISFLLSIAMLMLLSKMINNAINNSQFWEEQHVKDIFKAENYLMFGLVAIFALTLGMVYVQSGEAAALTFFKSNFILLLVLLFVYGESFHKIKIARGRWLKLKL